MCQSVPVYFGPLQSMFFSVSILLSSLILSISVSAPVKQNEVGNGLPNRRNAAIRSMFFFLLYCITRFAYWRTESSCVIRRNKIWKLKTLQIWTPLPTGATDIVASIYWRSAGIPILNSSADFLNPLCRVLPICQDITYLFCCTGAETEIHKITDDSKSNRE